MSFAFGAWLAIMVWDGAVAEQATQQANVGAAVDEAVSAISRGELAAAVWTFSDLLDDPSVELTARQRGTVHFNRGYAYQASGSLPEAIGDYTIAVEIEPQDYLALFNRGIAFEDGGQIERAMRDYTAAIGIMRTDPRIFYNRGNLFFDAGRLGLAIADYGRAIALDPNYADAYANRAGVFAAMGAVDLAIADIRTARALEAERSAGGTFGIELAPGRSVDLPIVSPMRDAVTSALAATLWGGITVPLEPDDF
ncbi:MAG: tetratricopeptide repeat protein [Alphaproteobacteria bacterium]|nr:tetratricopeptide repeat protein [Alphaproteobacteria bacterium]